MSAVRVTARTPIVVLGGLANLAVVALFARWVYLPHIRYDDINFLTRSRTWGEAFAGLWEPMNDHAMPLCRLAAAVLMSLVRGQARIPMAAQIQGPLAVVLGMWVLYLFVRRELGHPLYGLVAMTAWGVTTTYIQAVTWYSASFFILALDTFLLGLLSAQAWRRTHRWPHLVACAIWCALAPGWFGGGILAGAWCALYLLPDWPIDRPEDSAPAPLRRPLVVWLLRCWPAAVPLAGSLLFLAVSLPKTASRIIHAGHYQGKTVFEAFNLPAGLENTVRTLADNQVLGAFGVHRSAAFSWPTAIVIVCALAAIGALWYRAAPHRRLLLLGLAVILASDVLTYSARADWSYERTVHTWTRYHLFPHLGVVLLDRKSVV
jgi:hypothetical protein